MLTCQLVYQAFSDSHGHTCHSKTAFVEVLPTGARQAADGSATNKSPSEQLSTRLSSTDSSRCLQLRKKYQITYNSAAKR
jgi:hypothetical protein